MDRELLRNVKGFNVHHLNIHVQEYSDTISEFGFDFGK